MKKLVSILTFTIIIFSITACSSDQNLKKEMYIQKAELTQEEQSILEFVGSENIPYILNFLVDDTVQSLQINIYELQDGKWQMISDSGTQISGGKSRIALTFDNLGLGLRTAIEHKGSNSYKIQSDFDFEGLNTTTSYLTYKTTIQYEKEMPLVIQIHTSEDNISSLTPKEAFYKPETYANKGYEKVYAITCLFSQKIVNEISK